jgi:4-oxalocrotonate tautomerase
MPIVNIKVLQGVFDRGQLEAMIDEVTDAMCRVGGEAMRPATHVLVEEVASGFWGIGGEKLRTEVMIARRVARPKTA